MELNSNKPDFKASVDASSCTSLSSVFDLLFASPNGRIGGGVGNSENTNLRTLLTNPNIGAYVTCHIVLESYDVGGNCFAKCYASNVITNTDAVKTKILKKTQNNLYYQSSWS